MMDAAPIGPSDWSVGQPAEATLLLPLRPSCLPPRRTECLAHGGLRVRMEEQGGDPPPITDAEEDHRAIGMAELRFRRVVVDVAKRAGEPTDVADGYRAGTELDDVGSAGQPIFLPTVAHRRFDGQSNATLPCRGLDTLPHGEPLAVQR